MSKTAYVRCPNPKCRKMNPIQPDEAEQGREHTCIFCGQIIPPEKTSGAGEGAPSSKKDQGRGFPRQKSESRPVNRNTRKPLF